ncbi:hypothetical protein [Psychroserpens burtonensis]|uniref:hypothetical protein n=1 Tax=Psychroserpens burtonensis TaxID=49278 RepID=UPI00048E49CB|nr:hypothetical protein [Psychroserpens burtonensis]
MNKTYNLVLNINKVIPLIFLFIVSLSVQNLSAQNFKKVFKNIEKDKVEKATEAFKKISSSKEYTALDIIKTELATVLIRNSKSSNDYNCYEALKTYKQIQISKKNETEITEFLKKYNLTLTSIEDNVYKNILGEAKELDTEASYEKAIALCDSCYFFKEAKSLMANAAFKEVQQKNDIQSYIYFTTTYKNSEYYEEAYNKLTELEFYKAKSKNSVEGLNSFIEKYDSKNEYVLDAISIKDSLVYFRTPKKYKDYKLFVQTNKASKYYSIAQSQLPDILFDEAKKENNISLFDLFLKEFPKEDRVTQIKSDFIPNLLFEQGIENQNTDFLERFISDYPNETKKIDLARNNLETIYTNSLLNSYAPLKFESFKEKFPSSESIKQIELKYSIILKESDWNKNDLNGRVKNIITKGYYYEILPKRTQSTTINKFKIFATGGFIIDDRELQIDLEESYNENGNYEKVILNGGSRDNLEKLMKNIRPYKLSVDTETASIHKFGELKHFGEYLDDDMYISGSRYGEVLFKYNSFQKLTEVIHKNEKHSISYEESQKMISIRRTSLSYDNNNHTIKYLWSKNRLSKKTIYDNQNALVFNYSIQNNGNQIILEITNEYNQIDKRIISTKNNKGNITNEVIENFNRTSGRNVITAFTKKYFTYSKHNKLLTVKTQSYSRKNSKFSASINAFYGNPIKYDNGEFYVGPIESITNIIRDKNNMVTAVNTVELNKKNYQHSNEYRHGVFGVWGKRWEYVYDENNNWIQRIEYEVLDGNESLKNKNYIIKRDITYY